jgi:hypothetical protein
MWFPCGLGSGNACRSTDTARIKGPRTVEIGSLALVTGTRGCGIIIVDGTERKEKKKIVASKDRRDVDSEAPREFSRTELVRRLNPRESIEWRDALHNPGI